MASTDDTDLGVQRQIIICLW